MLRRLSAPLAIASDLLLDHRWTRLLQVLVFAGEALLTWLIIRRVRFTNIDWNAYVEQVEQFREGERDYGLIKGDTGPLVYPAGFLWIYSGLYRLSDRGTNVKCAQYAFGALYLATQAVVFKLYTFTKHFPPYIYILLALSKRLHSIYVLRLFNDGVAMFFLYGSILSLCYHKWRLGSVLFSVALSVKMSILLFLPALALVVALGNGVVEGMFLAMEAVAIQVLLALPFLVHDWRAYLAKAFEFSRVFLYKWTVNWRFLPEAVFLSRGFASALLLGHIGALLLAATCWCRRFGGVLSVISRLCAHPREIPPSWPDQLKPSFIVTVFFSCNLIGMTFARSLHYQFYAWEAWQLPFLAWSASLPTSVRFALLVGIEYGWETYPSTSASSLALVVSHVVLVWAALTRTDWMKA